MPSKRKHTSMSKSSSNKKPKLKPQLFVYPEVQPGCDCKICTVRNEVDCMPPPSPFHFYRIMKSEPDGSVREATAAELRDIKAVVKGMQSQPVLQKQWVEWALAVVQHLLADIAADCFTVRVDYVHFNILDYPKLVKHPMDFRIVQKRLGATPPPLAAHYLPPKYPLQPDNDEKLYSTPAEFVSDVRMIFRNAYLYNKKGDFTWNCAKTLSRKFETKLLSLWEGLTAQ
jgi:hypothetical protein